MYPWHFPHFSVISSGNNSWGWFPVLSFKTKPLLLQCQDTNSDCRQLSRRLPSYRYLPPQWMAWMTSETLCMHTHTHKMQNHIQVQVTFYHAAASRNSDEDRFSHVPSFCVSFLQHQPLKSVLDKCSWHQGLISPSLLLCPRHRPVNPFNVRWI